MKKVITYGTFDLLHYGHIKILERAKALGDYLIVGVTSEDFDKKRGKINVQQSLTERINAVKKTGLADEIIVEEYEGQKIDDIIKMGVDIFTVGSDWEGKFDYLKEYCEVIYLPRTEGISSSDIRTNKNKLKFGLVGNEKHVKKMAYESSFVNGLELVCICTNDKVEDDMLKNISVTEDFDSFLDKVDALYIISHPSKHYEQIKKALLKGKHVICESPITQKKEEANELFKLAEEKHCILMESLKTAYSTAYQRLLLLLKGEIIGKITSVDVTCTSLTKEKITENTWNSICSWGPTAMLPVFQILGFNYVSKQIYSLLDKDNKYFDLFTKISFTYDKAVAEIKVGKGIKSEGQLIISGTDGYVYVPAPWWKMDYFEIRYEDQNENKRYFYRLDGEGIRNELVEFVKMINFGKKNMESKIECAKKIIEVIEDFNNKKDFIEIR